MEKLGIYPGTFDPITFGHLDVIEISSKIFDKVIVVISNNISKKSIFQEKVRQKIIEKEVKKLKFKNVDVVIHNGLTAHLANSLRAISIIRGLRLTTDYESELDMSFNNRMLSNGVDTIFIAPKQEHIHIRSSTVRELIKFNSINRSCLANYIPNSVIDKIIRME